MNRWLSLSFVLLLVTVAIPSPMRYRAMVLTPNSGAGVLAQSSKKVTVTLVRWPYT